MAWKTHFCASIFPPNMRSANKYGPFKAELSIGFQPQFSWSSTNWHSDVNFDVSLLESSSKNGNIWIYIYMNRCIWVYMNICVYIYIYEYIYWYGSHMNHKAGLQPVSTKGFFKPASARLGTTRPCSRCRRGSLVGEPFTMGGGPKMWLPQNWML